MKVYIVSYGYNNTIEAVFSDEQAADDYVEAKVLPSEYLIEQWEVS